MTRLIAIVLLLGGMLGCTPERSENLAELHERAMQLAASHDHAELEQALQVTDEVLARDQNHLAARATRINILLQLGQVDAVVEEARELQRVDDTAENHLYVCMVSEFAQRATGAQQCYRDVMQRMEQEGRNAADDANYLMALKMADAPAFEENARDYIQRRTGPEAEIATYMYLESGREETLRRYFTP